MEREILGELKTDESLPIFVPEVREATMRYAGLRCPCGGLRLRLSGWLAVASGKGGFFWRSLTRVWREARQSMSGGALVDSPLRLPIFVRCDACEREESIFDDEALLERLPTNERDEPRESLRCRVCRRGRFELVVGLEEDELRDLLKAVELISRCHRCHRQERLAWSGSGLTDQEVRLDLLYGRR